MKGIQLKGIIATFLLTQISLADLAAPGPSVVGINDINGVMITDPAGGGTSGLPVIINNKAPWEVTIKEFPMKDVQELIAGYGSKNTNYLNIGEKITNPSFSRSNGFNLESALQDVPSMKYSNTLGVDNSFGLLQTLNELSASQAMQLTKYAFCVPGSDSYTLLKDKVDKACPQVTHKPFSNAATNVDPRLTPTVYTPDLSLNANTLLLPLAYPIAMDEQGNADINNQIFQPPLDYMKYLLGLLSPPKKPEILSKLATTDMNSLTLDQKKMIIDYRGHLAVLSIAFSNLMRYYVERLPTIANPFSGIFLTKDKKDQPLVSPLEIENYIATNRARSQAWHDAMEKQVPVILQREDLFIHADQLYETHQLRMEIERMNATMSAMLVMQQAMMDKVGGNDAQEEQDMKESIAIH